MIGLFHHELFVPHAGHQKKDNSGGWRGCEGITLKNSLLFCKIKFIQRTDKSGHMHTYTIKNKTTLKTKTKPKKPPTRPWSKGRRGSRPPLEQTSFQVLPKPGQGALENRHDLSPLPRKTLREMQSKFRRGRGVGFSRSKLKWNSSQNRMSERETKSISVVPKSAE